MKKITIAFAVCLFITAAALVAFFLGLINIGKFIEGGDLSQGIAAILTVFLTAVPVILDLPVALALIVIAICLFAVRSKRGSTVAALVILSIFLPVLLFSGILNLSTVQSIPYAALVLLCEGTYLASFVLSIVQLVFLQRERRQGIVG